MTAGRLLLVAPDATLRRSLVFALESEGFSVTARDTVPARAWLAENRFDCTIVDQHAFTGKDYETIAFCIKAHPVVLMASQPHAWLTDWVVATLAMPLRAGDVTTAIRKAMFVDA